jgi:hypothetical protein
MMESSSAAVPKAAEDTQATQLELVPESLPDGGSAAAVSTAPARAEGCGGGTNTSGKSFDSGSGAGVSSASEGCGGSETAGEVGDASAEDDEVQVLSAAADEDVQVLSAGAPPVPELPDVAAHVPGCLQQPSQCRCAVWWLWCRRGPYQPFPHCGKWMLFVTTNLDAVWARVVALTHAGRLGHAAKVAGALSRDGVSPALICIYLPDSYNIREVMRVLCTLEDEGLKGGGAYLNYKMDSQTMSGVYAAGDKRPRENDAGAAGEAPPQEVQWPSGVTVSRYTSPPSAASQELRLHLNHVTDKGTPWRGGEDDVKALKKNVRSLVAVRKGGEDGSVVFAEEPYELQKK